MKTYFQISLALFLAIGAGAAGHDAAKRSAAAERDAKELRAKIRAELKKLGEHEWAGEYYAGDGLGVNTWVAIAPESGYVFEWHGCLGLYDRNYGAVTWTNGRVRLSFTYNNQRKGFQGIAPELVPIAWGPRRYLVPTDEIIGFCNEVNQGREARTSTRGTYLLRKGDESKTVIGFPQVPVKYQSYLRDQPIEATIIAVGEYTTRPSVVDWKFKDTPVTLDAGTNKGLRVGMELVVTEPRNVVEAVEITKVDADRAEGLMTRIGEDATGPKTGWRLSTLAPWNIGR